MSWILHGKDGLRSWKQRNGKSLLQGGRIRADRFKWSEISPISRVISPQLPIEKAIYGGYSST